jgi:hypothetical protein
MMHYNTVAIDNTTLIANYPHSPTDVTQSIQDFLEDQFSHGWSLVSFGYHSSSELTFVFSPNAQ